MCRPSLIQSAGGFIPSKSLKPEQAAARDLAITEFTEVVGASSTLDAITNRLVPGRRLKPVSLKSTDKIQAMAYYLTAQGGSLSH